MAHLQKGSEWRYQDIGRVSDMISDARNVREVREIWSRFIEENWRGKEFHSKVGGITDRISSTAYKETVPELTKILSELNEGLRKDILEGRKKPGMEKMTADAFEEPKGLKNSKGESKSVKGVVEDLLSNDLKAKDVLLELRHGVFGPDNMSELMKELNIRYKSPKEDAERILGLMRSINANLASEYAELRGNLASQETFKRLNLP